MGRLSANRLIFWTIKVRLKIYPENKMRIWRKQPKMRAILISLSTTLGLLFLFAGLVGASPITMTVGPAPFSIVDSFGLPDGEIPGIYNTSDLMIAESFAGQMVSGGPGASFESVSGSLTNPLTLLVPAAQNGVYITSGRLAGLAQGLNDIDIGEGLMSLLFTLDQATVGISLVGGNGGSCTLDFFARDGSLLDSVALTNLANLDYTFSSAGPQFAGITISNTDPGGIGIDNLRFDPPSDSVVPLPSSLVLLASGSLGMLAFRIRQR
jgi:hypothetical protein